MKSWTEEPGAPWRAEIRKLQSALGELADPVPGLPGLLEPADEVLALLADSPEDLPLVGFSPFAGLAGSPAPAAAGRTETAAARAGRAPEPPQPSAVPPRPPLAPALPEAPAARRPAATAAEAARERLQAPATPAPVFSLRPRGQGPVKGVRRRSLPPPDLTPDPSPIAPPPSGRGAPPPVPREHGPDKLPPLPVEGGVMGEGGRGGEVGRGKAPAAMTLTEPSKRGGETGEEGTGASWEELGARPELSPAQRPSPRPSPTRTHARPGEGAPAQDPHPRPLSREQERGERQSKSPPLPGGSECGWERGLGGEGLWAGEAAGWAKSAPVGPAPPGEGAAQGLFPRAEPEDLRTVALRRPPAVAAVVPMPGEQRPGEAPAAGPAFESPFAGEALADLINEALIEQARRHGVDLS